MTIARSQAKLSPNPVRMAALTAILALLFVTPRAQAQFFHQPGPRPGPRAITCPAGDRTVVFTNYCDQAVWIGATGGGNGTACGAGNTCPAGQACNTANNLCFWVLPTPSSGSFELSSGGGSTTICFPSQSGDTQWNGNLFGRTGCTSNGCQTGNCGGGTGACNIGVGPSGPTTLSEFNLGAGSTGDNYDVGVINGENLTMEITPNPLPPPTPGNPYICSAVGDCSWFFEPQTVNNYDEGLMHNVAPISCSSTKLCPVGSTCSNNAGGYCQCTQARDCLRDGAVCGLAQNTGLGTLAQVCGKPIGWWTANEICGTDSSFGAPFNCSSTVSNSKSGNSTTYANLFACQGTNGGDCYNSSTGLTPDCCGCPNTNTFTPNNSYSQYWPALIAGQQCYNSNQVWVDDAQPWLVFLKKACPTAYSFPDDDATSSFSCSTHPNYNVYYCPERAPRNFLHNLLSDISAVERETR
jgi:hypothetical protein